MRELNLNLNRDNKMINLSDRLNHKKQCSTETKRVFNAREREINLAYDLINSGRLHGVGKCVAITTIEELEKYKKKVLEVGEYVLDMETTGLDIFNDIIVGMCIYVEGLDSAYIPINHTDIHNVRVDNQLTENQVVEVWREIFENQEVKHLFHNGKYDYKVIWWNWDIRIANVYFDTLIGSFLLNETEPHGLKPLYNKYILNGQGDSSDFGDYFGDTPFNYIPIEVATIYGANDGIKTYQLYKFQTQFLRPDHEREDMRKLYNVLMDIEMPLIPMLADIELRGVEIREEYANELAKEMRAELDEIIKEMDKDIEGIMDKIQENEDLVRLMKKSGKINYSSPSQLQILFYDVLGLKSGDRKNPRGTGEPQLERLKEKYGLPFINNLLRYRGLNKLLTTYVEKIPSVLEPKTGAVHTQFNQLGAKTGRFSSGDKISKLNLQNIPSKEKRIRKIFKAREGYYLVGGDFSQIEPRTLASLSGDEKMKQAYIDGKDLYSIMASEIYGVPVEECKEFRPDGTVNPDGKDRRTSVKSILLGIMYGRGTKSIAEQIGKSEAEAEKIVDNFFRGFPVIKEYQQGVIYRAEKTGYVSTLFGRKRRLPDMKLPRDDYKYQQAYRQTINSVIQGTAGDLMKLAMKNIYYNERIQELGIKILMTIHDELICEVPKEHVKEGAELISTLMKEVGEKALGLPMKCDMEVSNYWYGENVEIE